MFARDIGIDLGTKHLSISSSKSVSQQCPHSALIIYFIINIRKKRELIKVLHKIFVAFYGGYREIA